MPRALITTVPFADKDKLPLQLLETAGIDYVINPLNKKLSAIELADLIPDFDVIIAGTEEINETVLRRANKLRFISRVGIGLDSVDLAFSRENNIKVSYTPDAPAPAVAEFALGLMLSLLRSIQISNAQMHEGRWQRYFGRRLGDVTVGIIGAGRIGSRVIEHLSGFKPAKILVYDIDPNRELDKKHPIEWVSREEIYRSADVISLHLPLTAETKNLVNKDIMLSMKPDALLINTSRGGIINEDDLYEVMAGGHLAGAGIDVFEQEPYNGPLKEIERCILTAHMGSMSIDCRTRMEIEATEEAIRFLQGLPLLGEVPESEYKMQAFR